MFYFDAYSHRLRDEKSRSINFKSVTSLIGVEHVVTQIHTNANRPTSTSAPKHCLIEAERSQESRPKGKAQGIAKEACCQAQGQVDGLLVNGPMFFVAARRFEFQLLCKSKP